MYSFLRSNKLLLAQSLLFIFISLSFIWTSGNYSCIGSDCTLSIGDWHMHDALWHISLAKLGFDTWPLQNPFMSGERLSGYNFLLDYVLYILLKLGISPFTSFFKILPLIASLLYVWSVLKFMMVNGINRSKSNFYAFFMYFGSSFSYLAMLYSSGTLAGSTLRGFPVVSAISPTTMFLNIQFAFSLSVILWMMILLKSSAKLTKSIFLGILFFLLFGLKFYGALVMLFIYSMFVFKDIVTRRITKAKITEIFSIGLFSILGLWIFYGIGASTSSPFSLAPFALTHLFIDDPLLFYNHSLTLARYYLYENSIGFSPRLWGIEILSIFLFIMFNFGTRLLSTFYIVRSILLKKVNWEQIVYTLVIVGTFLIPILFVQDGGWYNTMQFLYYGLWFAGILSAEFMYYIYSSKYKFKYFFVVLIILLTIPNVLDQLRYITKDQITISSDELNALSALRDAPDGIVHVNSPEHRNAHIPAIAEKITYYLDTDQLMVTHAPYVERLDFVNKYKGGSITTVPADYFYIYKTEWGTEDAIQALSNPGFKIIYESDMIAVYQKVKLPADSL